MEALAFRGERGYNATVVPATGIYALPFNMAKKRTTKKQADHQQLARKVLDTIVPDAEPQKAAKEEPEKNPAAVALGRLGGLKGGKARAEKLSAAKRKAIAKKAAAKRWANNADKS